MRKPKKIGETEARSVAYSWHGGQWSPLYEFASSGHCSDRDRLLGEVFTCQRDARKMKNTREQGRLNSLEQFVRDTFQKTSGENDNV